MKRIIAFTSVYLLLAFYSFGQKDSTNFEKLLNEFSQQYAYAAQSPTANFMTQLYDATISILNIENPVFVKTKTDFTKFTGASSNEDSILIRITDSIFKRFTRDFFWLDQQVDLIRFRTILTMYNDKLCECLSTKFIAGHKGDIIDMVDSCDSINSKDTVFMTRFNTELKKVSIGERQKLIIYLSKYAYEHCPTYNQGVNQPIFKAFIRNHRSLVWKISSDMEEKIVRLYTKNKLDSLRLIFPDYAMYKMDIEKSAALIKKKTAYTVNDVEKDKNDPRLTNRSIIFFRDGFMNGVKTTLFGQVTSSYTIDNFVLQVKSYRFIPAEKIKDKDKVIERLEPPPPPIPELKKKNQ